MAKDTYGIALGMIETRGLVAAQIISRPHRGVEPALGDEMGGSRPGRS